jgi:hypothetical protein
VDQGDVVVGDPHAAAAAAARRLDHHGIADPVGDLDRLLVVLDRLFAARDRRNPALLGQLARAHLVHRDPAAFGAGPDELDVAALAHLGEVGVLRRNP